MTKWVLAALMAATVGAGCSSAQAPAPGSADDAAAVSRPAGPGASEYREVTLPAGTMLPLELTSTVGSNTSTIEDTVRAELRSAIAIDGREIVPAGAKLVGSVTEALWSGRVKGRARVSFQFTSLDTGSKRYDISSAPISAVADATKGEDATKIAIGAGAGAAVGAVLGGKQGAGKGAAIGGSGGAGVVLATRGSEVRLEPGAEVATPLTAPLTIRVRVAS